jgi:parallel beta-helix repeat protein
MRRALSLVAATLIAAWAAPAANAATPQCGDTVTKNVTLNHDFTTDECANNGATVGLHIGANGIVVDLKGHTIQGAGEECCTTGIAFEGHNHVTVRNGSIVGWGAALSVVGDDNTIQRIGSGVQYEGVGINGNRNRLLDSNQSGSIGPAVEVFGDGNLIAGNIATNANTEDPLPGAMQIHGADNTIRDSRVSGGASVMIQSSLRTQVLRNVFGPAVNDNGGTASSYVANTFSGLNLNNTTNAVVTGNRAIGFALFGGSGQLLVNNRAQFNSGGPGFDLESTAGATLRDNTAGSASGSAGGTGGNATGILLSDTSGFSPATGTLLDGNAAHGNAGDGILVQSASGTTVRNNRTNRNGGDGISDLSGGGTLTSNIAAYNQRYGIEAGGGATDGGGNHAFGNVLGQCVGVACP